MKRPVLVLLIMLSTLTRAVGADERQRGVSWVADGPVTVDDLRPLLTHNVNWISQTPFGWQRGLDSPQIIVATSGRVMWGESDEGLEATARLARGIGIHTLLKPHLWITGPEHGAWSGDIRMKTPADWAAWFAAYEQFIIHYARLAETTGIEALSVGTELRGTLAGHDSEWRKMITEVRKVFHGKLTYSANWHAEFEEVSFWDLLDTIGVQSYFPLTDTRRPGLDRLLAGWTAPTAAIEQVQKRHGKPVVFTEMGYRSMPDAAIEPWKWPGEFTTVESDFQTQADCYEAFFRNFWDKSWFGGAYIWKWYPRPRKPGGRSEMDFTPQNKPAEQVMGRWYRGEGRKEPSKTGPATGSPSQSQ